MATLNDISGIDNQARTLLEAIDVTDAGDLAREEIGSLYARLYQTNKEQHILDSLPAIEKIESWITNARQLEDADAPPADEENDDPDSGDEDNDTDVRNEETAPLEPQAPETDSLAADLAASAASAASPEDAPANAPEQSASSEASVEDDAPASPASSTSHATLLLGLENDVWMEAYDQAAEAIVLEPAPASSLPEPPAEFSPKRKTFRKPDHPASPFTIPSSPQKRSKRRKTDPLAGAHHHPPREEQSLGSDNPANLGGHRSALKTKSRLPTETSLRIATAIEDLPKHARRGLLHPQPIVVACGFLIVIITRILIVAMLIGTPVVLMYFSDYILYFAAVPALLVLFALLYVVFSSRIFCRVCGTNILIPQRSHKHEKAHHLFGFGHVGSTALHGLFFGWFRCLQCGTPMRIRE